MLPVGVQAEEGAHGHAHGQVPRPRVEVDLAPRRHLLEGALGLLDDHIHGGGDVVAVECRQHDHSRAAVELTVDRQQPIAHQTDQVAEVPVAPEEVGGV